MEIKINVINKRKFRKVKNIDFDLYPGYVNPLFRSHPFFRGRIEIDFNGVYKRFTGEFMPDTFKNYGFAIELK